MGIAAFVLGICSLALGFVIPTVGTYTCLIMGIIAIVLGKKGMKQNLKLSKAGYIMGIIGTVLNSIGIVIGILAILGIAGLATSDFFNSLLA